MDESQESGRRKVSIDIEKANVFGVCVMLGAAIVLVLAYFLIWPEKFSKETLRGVMSLKFWAIFFVAMVVGIVVHELIHGITFACFAKRGWKSISFGVMWKLLTPYCHCDEPMALRHFQIAALMPLLVLGIIPAVLALCIPSLLLLGLGIFFIAGAVGDIWMAWLLTKEDPASKVLDHPSEAGYYVYPPEQ